jgi:elongation factor P
MIVASQLRAGMAIRFEGQNYKVVSSDYHPGQGKMGGVAHVRLKNLASGTFREHSFRAEIKLDPVPVEKQPLEYLYSDAEQSVFMNPITFEQVAIQNSVIGPQIRFLQPEMQLPVEFVEGQPVSIVFPDIIEVTVAGTAPPAHGQQDNTWKTARLSNGIDVMVPQFIKNGDIIRLDVAALRYVDRAKSAAG